MKRELALVDAQEPAAPRSETGRPTSPRSASRARRTLVSPRSESQSRRCPREQTQARTRSSWRRLPGYGVIQVDAAVQRRAALGGDNLVEQLRGPGGGKDICAKLASGGAERMYIGPDKHICTDAYQEGEGHVPAIHALHISPPQRRAQKPLRCLSMTCCGAWRSARTRSTAYGRRRQLPPGDEAPVLSTQGRRGPSLDVARRHMMPPGGTQHRGGDAQRIAASSARSGPLHVFASAGTAEGTAICVSGGHRDGRWRAMSSCLGGCSNGWS